MSTSGEGAVPPPPGQQANFVDPPDQQTPTIALHTVCLFFVTLCVVIRIYTRRFVHRHLGIDDCETRIPRVDKKVFH